jgi:hypothetical protein
MNKNKRLLSSKPKTSVLSSILEVIAEYYFFDKLPKVNETRQILAKMLEPILRNPKYKHIKDKILGVY